MHEQLPDWPPRDTVSDYFGMSKRQWLEVASVYALVAVLFGAIWIERHRSVSKPMVVDPPASFSDRFDHNWITTAPVAPHVLVPPVVADGTTVFATTPSVVVVPNDPISIVNPMEEVIPRDLHHPAGVEAPAVVALPHITSIQIDMHRDIPKPHAKAAKVAVVKRSHIHGRRRHRHAVGGLHCIPWQPCQVGLIVYAQEHRFR